MKSEYYFERSFKQKHFLYKVFIAFCICLFVAGIKLDAQSIQMKGRIMDDASTAGLKDAVAMVVRLSDSVLIKFVRAGVNGNFNLSDLPVDTFQVIFSHPKFGDKTFVIVGNPADTMINFSNIPLPLKSVQLNEVTVFGYKSPVYFKGDTLVYTADSFDVKPNAVVEDLLKKLPGIRVDKDGKIFAQGKAVDQVLVDGDEFFGSDPTIATKNLAANSVESVQVYEKKNDDANAESETLQVMNLQLKEDAKKGHFGKISGASDFSKFYEGEVLMNKFKGKQKVSVFGLISNTPRSQFGWDDMWQYGIEDENMNQWEEDGVYYSSWTSGNNTGIPQTLRTGFYYTDQIAKRTKLSLNYTYGSAYVETPVDESAQYLFPDTTYFTYRNSNERKRTENNTFNVTLNQKFDSLGELEFKSKIKFGSNSRYYNETNKFITTENSLQRETDIENDNQGKKSDLFNSLRYTLDFKKKFRKLTAFYSYGLSQANSSGYLYSVNSFFAPPQPEDITDQWKQNESRNDNHTANISFTEPLTKKIKLELSYDYSFNKGLQDVGTFDNFNGEYIYKNDTLSNDFENSRLSNRAGLKFIYEVKKYSLHLGIKARQVTAENLNNENNQTFSQTVNMILPFAGFRYKFSDNTQLNLRYNTKSNQPSLNQLQPVPDNSNPNSLTIGNPDLLPTYTHGISAWFNTFRPVKGNSMWASIDASTTNNQISNSVFYDSLGRNITQPINVDGNYNLNYNFYYTHPLWSKLVELSPNIDGSYNSNSNFINGSMNITRNTSINGGLDVTINAEPVEITLGGYYGSTFSKATINNISNEPFIQAGYSGAIKYEMPKKFKIETDLSYRFRNDKSQGNDIVVYEWNASFSKSFFKKESLILSVEAYDLLNQNVEVSRNVEDNIITDTKAQVIKRYFLFRVIFKFNSNKEEEEGNE